MDRKEEKGASPNEPENFRSLEQSSTMAGLVSDIMFVMVLCFVVLLVTMLTQSTVTVGSNEYDISMVALFAVGIILALYLAFITGESWWRGDEWDPSQESEHEKLVRSRASLFNDIIFVMVLCFVVLLITMLTQNNIMLGTDDYHISYIALAAVAAILVVYLATVLRRSTWLEDWQAQVEHPEYIEKTATQPGSLTPMGKIGLVADIGFVMVLCFVVLLVTMATQNSIGGIGLEYTVSPGALVAVAAIMAAYMALIVYKSQWHGDEYLLEITEEREGALQQNG